ncbi:helix-turn-helix transcriptional regulator [Desulfosporosinus sp. FKB]|uniref:substrate-binding domain-containing protein n=1 Tax=Desulfosporosinus sp. FKB TaxID=1969835 RepID=UPI000B49E405|nr:helix-turn-helix transcriptional regulator [Desulfosporosinus sp. FKB]
MSQTLTPVEAAKILKISTYTMYELIKRGEIPAQRIGRQLRVDPAVLDHYLHGTMSNYKTSKTIPSENLTQPSLCFIGSHDPVVELLFEFLKHNAIPIETSLSFRGSMDGLIALYNGEADITGIHLWDNDLRDYNISYVRHIIPNESVCIVNLVQRQQGFIVASGNPLNLETWDDLTQVGVRFVNRQKGSGTRLRIDSFLQAKKISPDRIQGYAHEETTHSALACLIANGQADVGVGVKAAAKRLGLDFIPLFQERYDLVCLGKTAKTSIWNQLLNTLGSPGFIQAVNQQTGYDTSMTGKILLNT